MSKESKLFRILDFEIDKDGNPIKEDRINNEKREILKNKIRKIVKESISELINEYT